MKAALPSLQAFQVLRKLTGNKKLAESVVCFQQGLLARELPPAVGKLLGLGGLAESERSLRQGLELARDVLAPNHGYIAFLLHELARTLEVRGKNADAEACYREALGIGKHYGLEHPKVQILVVNYSQLLRKLGKRDQADQLLDATAKATRARFGPSSVQLAGVLVARARLLDLPQDAARKEQVLRDARTMFRQGAGRPRRMQLVGLVQLAHCVGSSRPAEAETLVEEALVLGRKLLGPDHSLLPTLLCDRAWYRMADNKNDKVEGWLEEAQALVARNPGHGLDNTRQVWANLERCYRKLGRPAQAVAAALELRRLAAGNPRELYEVALALARNAALVDTATPARTRFEDLAMETLRQARGRGFADLTRLRAEKGFDLLRNRSDFQMLIREMEKSHREVQSSSS